MECSKMYEDYKQKCELTKSNTDLSLKSIPNHDTNTAVNCINMIKSYSSCLNENKNKNENENDKK